jgi:integrase
VRQRRETKTKVVLGDLKTARSRRTLFLVPPMVTALRRHLARQAEERLAAGSAWQDHGLLFPSEVGTPLHPDNFSHWFTWFCRVAGLGHWHPHDLRHSGASLMLAQGVRLDVVSEILGHASIAITKDVYGQLWRATSAELQRAWRGCWSGRWLPKWLPKAAERTRHERGHRQRKRP